jgi:excisionase family DNA binding protein
VSTIKKRITVNEAAGILGLSTGRIRKMILDGVIKDVEKFGRDNAIAADEIDRLKNAERPTGRPKKEKE